MATASNVKLPDLINRWIEVQKKGTGFERTKPLDIDAINLTLLLKSMGLRLKFLDYEADKSNAENLTVTIKCNRSGMRADLTYDLTSCSCPEKTERESSFWEVQATGPKVFSKFKNNTSSNLLPDVSESCSLVAKAMLSNLLDFYQASIRQVKEEKEQAMLHSPLKSPRPNVCVTSPGLSSQTPFSTPPAEGRSLSRIDTVSSNANSPRVETHEQHEKHDSMDNLKTDDIKNEPMPGRSSSRGSSEGQTESKSNSSSESVGINNKTHDIVNSDCHTDKPVIDSVHSPGHSSVPDDNAFEAMKTLVTSSPNEKPFSASSDTFAGLQHDRDLNVINCLQQARSQIDMALLFMKVNTTQDLAEGSAFSITPQHTTAISRKSLVTPQFVQPRSNSLLSIERRRPPVDIGVKKRPSSLSYLASTSKSVGGITAGRADTPRPSIVQAKSVGTLRKTVTMPPPVTAGAVRQFSSSGGRKSFTGTLGASGTQRKIQPPNTPTSSGRCTPKPPTSGRSMSNLPSGLLQRSASAAHIMKK